MEQSANSTAIESERSLSELLVGESGIVKQMVLTTTDYARLASMGLCPGSSVEMIRTGKRIIIRSGATYLGLHPRLAQGVRVAG